MIDHRLNMLAAAAGLALAATAAATPAAAGDCCPGCACGLFTTEDPPYFGNGVYLVNQGPVFSGPGHDLPRQLPDAPPAAYPYVGFVYSGYPYGLQNSGGYPRGAYSPFTGYPYVEPPRGYHAPSYVNYRLGERAGHIYRRRW
jgi:hypothetical protein